MAPSMLCPSTCAFAVISSFDLLLLLDLVPLLPLQHCSQCGHELQAAVTTDGERSKYALRRCPACSRVWNRDSNAAVNMLHILLHQHGRGTKARPSHLARPPRQGPPALQPPAGEDDEEDMAGELAVG